MYRITYLRYGTCKGYHYYGYMGRNADSRAFFTKEFNTIEGAVNFTVNVLPENIYIKCMENFSKEEQRAFGRKFYSLRLKKYRKQNRNR